MITLTINYDRDTESPNDNYGFALYSFSRKHLSFKHPENFFTEGNDGLIPNIGIRRKLSCKTAFLLSYYEHGQCSWTLQNEGSSCPWDSSNFAGILVWEEKPSDLGKDYDAREKSARCFLEEYTNWCNGQCFYYSIERTDTVEDLDDSCGGFIGSEWVLEHLKDEHGELFDQDGDLLESVVVKGEASWIVE